MNDLRGKNILVIGGRGYLGRDFCKKLSENNATVISVDIPTISKASKNSSEYLFKYADQYDIDVTNEDFVNIVLEKILHKYTHIDVLVYAATTKPDDFYSPFTEASLSGWKKVIDVEMNGLFNVSKIIGKHMEENLKGGSIILISSIYGVVGNDQRIYKGANLDSIYGSDRSDQDKQIYSSAVYPAVKGAVISLTRYLAAYWGKDNIRVNCVSPGGIYHENENTTFLKNYCEKVPLGRKGSVGEISNAIVFLSSDESSYITGQNLIIDGGWTAW